MVDIATLGLEVKSDGVAVATSRLSRLDGTAARTEQATKRLTRSFRAIGTALKIGLIAGLAAATLSIRKFITASVEQQRVVKQLETALRSTGGAVGYTSQQLQDMAARMQTVTTYGDETVMSAQALLLTFTRIGKEAFPLALEATLNVATAMGTDLKSAAIQVGKALNDPIIGMTALTRSGITFSESQRETIKLLVETGKAAEAQKIILNELETQFGGSARAARDTLGGALKSLGNAFGDLFEIAGPGTDDLRLKIEGLITLVSADSTRAAFQTFGQWAIDALSGIITFAVKAIDLISSLKNIAGGAGAQGTDILLGQKANYERFGTDLGSNSGYQTVLKELRDRMLSGTFDNTGTETGTTFSSAADALQSFRDSMGSTTLILEPFTTGIAAANDNARALQETMNQGFEFDGLIPLESTQTSFQKIGLEIQRLNELLAVGGDAWAKYGNAAMIAVAQSASGILGSLASLSSGLSQAFENNKALSIATAVLKGAESIASSFAAGAQIGGPPVGAIYAGIAAITAAANVAAVAGVGQSSTSVPGGGGGGGSVPAPASTIGSQRTVNVFVQGSPEYRQNIEDVIAEINEAIGDGATLNVQAA